MFLFYIHTIYIKCKYKLKNQIILCYHYYGKVCDRMNIEKVSVHYNEIRNEINLIKRYISQLQLSIDSMLNDAISNGEWKGKYQEEYDNHINGKTEKYLRKLVTCFEDFNNYLEKTMQGYQKIDQ